MGDILPRVLTNGASFGNFPMLIVLNGDVRRWAYAQENNVQLPDEYDIINERLKPFWGVHPTDLRSILNDWENNSDVPIMVFGKVNGRHVRILKNGMPEAQKADFAAALMDRIQLMAEIEDDVPDFRAIISPADTPNLLSDWELRKAALDAAAKGKCMSSEHCNALPARTWS